MKNTIRNINTIVIISSLLGILLGILLIMSPGTSLITMGYLVGVNLLVFGVGLIYVDIKAKEYYIPFDGLLLGALSIVLSIVLFKNPSEISIVLSFAVGLWIIASSINDIRLAYRLRNVKGVHWILIIIINIFDILVGLYMLYAPAISSISIVTAAGITLIANSIVRLIDMFIIRMQIAEAEEYVVDMMNAVEKDVNRQIEAAKKAQEVKIEPVEEVKKEEE